MTHPAAGWYPDPARTGSYRYWNGTAWTDHVSPPAPAAQAFQQDPAVPQPPTPPPAAPAPAPQAGDPPSGAAESPRQPATSSAAGSDAPAQQARPDAEPVPAQGSFPAPPPPVIPPGTGPDSAQPAAAPLGSLPPGDYLGAGSAPQGAFPPGIPSPAPYQQGGSQPSPYPPMGPPSGAGWGPGQPGMAPVGVRPAYRLGPDGQVLAGWWRRLGGYVIDYLMIMLIAGLFVAGVGTLAGGFGEIFDTQAWGELLDKAQANPGYQPTEAELMELVGPGLFTFAGWLFVARTVLGLANGVVLVALTGQTVADRLVRTRKVQAGRRVPNFGWALLRWLLPEALVLVMASPLIGIAALGAWILNYLWPLWDPQRQALHDKAAKTFVERSDLAGAPNR